MQKCIIIISTKSTQTSLLEVRWYFCTVENLIKLDKHLRYLLVPGITGHFLQDPCTQPTYTV